ncbi:MAG: hypothetical protein HQ483_03135 [Rhodospirillales bacterium]|nr:hypothetical protein [Rhodospirillales bacterium]
MQLNDLGATDALLAKHGPPGTALTIVQRPSVPALSAGQKIRSHDIIGEAPSAIKQLAIGTDVRKISPHEISDFSLDLYAAGIISFEDYSALSQHPELNPSFNRTIGALTNEKAQPQVRRDMVRFWEEKLAFANRHEAFCGSDREQAIRIVGLLRYLSRRVLRTA